MTIVFLGIVMLIYYIVFELMKRLPLK